MAAYAVSKAALVHLTRVLDLELRPLGIRGNAVAPQLLDTAKTRPYLTPDLLAHAVTPEAVADTIAYLVSHAAAPVKGPPCHPPQRTCCTAGSLGLAAAERAVSGAEFAGPSAESDIAPTSESVTAIFLVLMANLSC